MGIGSVLTVSQGDCLTSDGVRERPHGARPFIHPDRCNVIRGPILRELLPGEEERRDSQFRSQRHGR